MEPTARPYRHGSDYERVGEFLTRTYQAAGAHVNWLQPRWEYMHFHPYIRNVVLSTIGVWELEERIVGVVHPEHRTGHVYLQIDPAHADLRRQMLLYAEEHLVAVSDEGRELSVFVCDADEDFQSLVADRGYVRTDGVEPMTQMSLADPCPAIVLPDGFRLQSLADDNDLWKIHCVLWRGFDHGDDPPDDDLADRRFMQSAPNFRHDLNIVVVTPQGDYASYCGMWFDSVHRFAYVEPVATDPRYRRMGLGSAAVREGMRRCGQMGAKVAYVGSALPIYMTLGFGKIYECSVWRRRWI